MAVNTHGTGGTIVQQTDYYPFGMDIAVYNGGLDNKYRYNGKEFQDDVINGRSLSWYDYGARFYDPTIGRWTTVDPLCEKGGQESWSPYHYVYNNPVKNTDPDGRIALIDNLIGLAIGAAVEYGGQVAANMIENGPSWSNLTDNIDLGDIALSAGEGFITSGASTLAKVTTAVVSEVARNAIDVKTSEDGSGKITATTNNVSTTVKNTAIGLTLGKLGEAAPAAMKVTLKNAPTANQAVKIARTEARKAGR